MAASQSLREAAQLDAEGKCDEAERYYQSALAKGSPSPALLNNAGNHYLACGDTSKAQGYFERLLELNPAHVNANLQLARIAAGRKQGRKALVYLARVKEPDPDILLLRAEALHWAGRTKEAAEALDQLAQTAQGNARLQFLLGLTYARLALYDRAETAFNNALLERPDDFDVLSNLGRAASRTRHYDRAQQALEAALKVRPGDVDVLVELGRVSAARQDYVRAVFLLAQARRKAPGNADLVLLLARAAEDAGYYEDAATAYDEYVKLRPDDDAARRDRARACGYVESRREEARREIAWYLARHPHDPQGHYAFAQIVWWPAPQEALAHLSEAARLDPNSVSIRFSRAWMLQRAGQMAESLPDLEAARRMAPESARILDLMGLAHLAMDQPARAEEVLREALAKSPDDPEAVMHMGRALMALGREEEAQSFLDKYRKIRPQGLPGVRTRVGMIELATLTASEQRARQIELYLREARQHPDRPDYQLHLSSLLLVDGRKEEARLEFRRLLGLNATSQVCEEAGSLLMSAGEYVLARDFLQRAAAERPSARLDLAIALLQVEGFGPALEYLETIPVVELGGDGLLLKADVLQAAGRIQDAKEVLDLGLKQAPASARVVLRAVPLLLRLHRSQDALNVLEQAIKTNPDDLELDLAKGVLLGLLDRFAAAETTLKGVESRRPEWDRAYLVHGLLLERSLRPAEARQRLRTAAALGSQDPALACALARLDAPASSDPQCACHKGLEQLLLPGCAQQR